MSYNKSDHPHNKAIAEFIGMGPQVEYDVTGIGKRGTGADQRELQVVKEWYLDFFGDSRSVVLIMNWIKLQDDLEIVVRTNNGYYSATIHEGVGLTVKTVASSSSDLLAHAVASAFYSYMEKRHESRQ